MKKILAIVLALVVVVAAFAACGGEKAPEANEGPAYADAVEVLTTIFGAYAEENKFAIAGGDEANMSFEGPAKYDYTLAEELNAVAKLPATQAANIEDAATAIHAMNANSFTSAAYKLVDGADAAAFAAEFKTELDNSRWMCGFPEKFVVIKTGSYLVTAYGVADIMDYYKTTVSALEGVEVVLEGDIVA
ncbi:MAG: hypothetical protein J6Q79_00480 [Clostridia bacterium]|nr:hypothetical protein [Clostridia bacterium]